MRGYREFIYGPFADHTTLIVLSIAALQLLMGVVALKGSRLGPLGAMIVLVAITPLGIGSGSPPRRLAYGTWRLYRGGSSTCTGSGSGRLGGT